MTANHDAFSARLAERIADWNVLVTLFADGNLTDRYGNAPKPETARKTWQRVRKKVAQARAKRATPDQKPTQLPAADRNTKPTTVTTDNDAIRAMPPPGRKMPAVDDDEEDPDKFFRTIAKPP